MSEFKPLNDELTEFEQNLKSLVPVTPALNEAELMFQLGREAALSESKRDVRRWQFSTLATSLCALLSASMLWFSGNEVSTPPGMPVAKQAVLVEKEPVTESLPSQTPPEKELVENDPQPEPTVAVVTNTKPPAAQQNNRWWGSFLDVSAPAPDSYLGLRNRVLEQGVDALPESTGGGSGGSEGRKPLNSSPRRVRQWLEESDLT